jgi:ribosome-binding protein aMBF1 (putative translation factor)
MSSRFTPAWWCAVDPRDFGAREQIEWKWDQARTDAEIDQLRIAQVHHDVIVRFRAALRERQWTQQDYADEVGYTRDRIGKVVRGTALLRLEDLAAMERLFEVRFLPVTRQRDPRQRSVEPDRGPTQ